MASGLLFFTDIPTFGFTTDLTAGEFTLTFGGVVLFCVAGFTTGAAAFGATGFAAVFAGAALAGAFETACFLAGAGLAFTALAGAFFAPEVLAGADFELVFLDAPVLEAGAGLTAFLGAALAGLAGAFFTGAAFLAPAAARAGLAGAFFTDDLAAGFAFTVDLTLVPAFFAGTEAFFAAGLAGAFLIGFLAITKSDQFVVQIRNGRMLRAQCQTHVLHRYGDHLKRACRYRPCPCRNPSCCHQPARGRGA
ncbi:MAG: hypothetical protein MUC87_09140 [Bacteroidia bacterium]|nr:hypothetical protein [Bacteroidia bacterium]